MFKNVSGLGNCDVSFYTDPELHLKYNKKYFSRYTNYISRRSIVNLTN